jgi:hypothetical protein
MSQAAAHGLIVDMESDGLKDLLVYTVAGAAPQAAAAGAPGAAANPPAENPAAANPVAANPIVVANPEGQHAAIGQGQAAGNQATATVLTDNEMCTFLKTRTASSTFYATLISSDGIEQELEFEVVSSGRDGRGTVRPVTRDGPPEPEINWPLDDIGVYVKRVRVTNEYGTQRLLQLMQNSRQSISAFDPTTWLPALRSKATEPFAMHRLLVRLAVDLIIPTSGGWWEEVKDVRHGHLDNFGERVYAGQNLQLALEVPLDPSGATFTVHARRAVDLAVGRLVWLTLLSRASEAGREAFLKAKVGPGPTLEREVRSVLALHPKKG